MRYNFTHKFNHAYSLRSPVQVDEDDTLRVIYESFQLPGPVPQLLSLCGGVGQRKTLKSTQRNWFDSEVGILKNSIKSEM